MEYSKIQPVKLYQRVVEQLEAQIVSGQLRNGDRLPNEREQAARFGVSRTAIREAMRTLSRMGLVEVRHGSGAYVRYGAPEAFRDSLGLMVRLRQSVGWREVSEIRQMLEPEIAALAARRISAEGKRRLRQVVETMEQDLGDAVAFVAADGDFHLALARATGNPLIPDMLDPIVELLQRQRMSMSTVPGGPERGQRHHRAILKAIETGDVEEARRAMQRHMRQVMRDSARAGIREEDV